MLNLLLSNPLYDAYLYGIFGLFCAVLSLFRNQVRYPFSPAEVLGSYTTRSIMGVHALASLILSMYVVLILCEVEVFAERYNADAAFRIGFFLSTLLFLMLILGRIIDLILSALYSDFREWRNGTVGSD